MFHPDPTGEDVTLSNIVLTNAAGTPTVTFHAATASGPVTDITYNDLRFYIADLVPADTPTVGYPGAGTQGTWDTPYFERWAYESSSETPDAAVNFSNDGDGDYTYTFVTSFADATAEAPDYNQAHTQRLVITAAGHDDANGNAVTNNTVGFLDFVTPAAGGAVTTSVSQRLFVTVETCIKCHGAPFQQAAHANRYLDTRACVICHSPIGHYGTNGLSGADMVRDNAYLPVLIHQIHAAIDNPAFEDQIRGLGFGAVTYPRNQSGAYEGAKACVSCHSNPDNLALGTGDQIDNYETHPTVEVCESCHVNFNTVENHAGGVQENGTCSVCHNGGIAPTVAEAHDTTLTGANVPEFDVTITMTAPVGGGGTYYDVGEAPEVTVTLKNHKTGQPVDPAVYTTPQDLAGHAGGGLSEANLYVYGPRAKAVPVLATGTITDPNFKSGDTQTQSHELFANGPDSKVTTDMTGFHYQLLAIPAGMTAGTYMVRFEGADYGGVDSTNYVTSSTALITFQVGQSAETPKVAGDACIDCHGATRMHLTGSHAHNVPFDTDYCLACHDQSGGYGVPIANRVHAVHSANSNGDLYFIRGSGTRDWSDITFPQNIQMADGTPRCVSCHTSGDGTYLTKPFMMPCVGCHGDADGVLDHMRLNGGPF